MRIGVRALSGLILGVLLCLALPVLGQTTTIYFNGGYQGDVWCNGSQGCVATGFYDGSINGVQVGPGDSSPGMICDDYEHTIVAGESWTATAIDVANLNQSNISSTQFGNAIGLTGYTELAYVVNLMFTTNPSSSQQSIYSQALWAITGGVKASQLSSGALSLYNWVVQNVGSLPALSSYADLMLYTPTNRGNNEPQEMWGELEVPEGGAAGAYLLLAGVFSCGAMFLRRRVRA